MLFLIDLGEDVLIYGCPYLRAYFVLFYLAIYEGRGFSLVLFIYPKNNERCVV